VISALLQLYHKSAKVASEAFDNLEAFHLIVREAMQAAIRPREHHVAELLARFLDSYLREGARRETDEAVDAAVTDCMRLFAFLPAKDVFEAFYADALAKRLVFQRVRSVELERSVIRHIRSVTGSTNSSKLDGMLKDVSGQDDINAAFLAWQHDIVTGQTLQDVPHSPTTEVLAGGVPGRLGEVPPAAATPLPSPLQSPTPLPLPLPQMLDSKYLIITNGFWPQFPRLLMGFSPLLQGCVDQFTAFYTRRHGGRRLEWLPALATCVVRAKIGSGSVRREISMNLIQGMVLEMFETDSDALSFETICKQLAKTPSDWVSVKESQETTCAMLSISGNPAQRLLTRQSGSMSSTIGDSEMFSVNTAFTHKSMKFRINQVQLKDSKAQQREQQESAAIQQKALQDRAHVIDAAVVRYMKSRRRASHTDVVHDVMGMLRFPSTATDIKKRIEVLMEREYVRRDAQDPSQFEYVA